MSKFHWAEVLVVTIFLLVVVLISLVTLGVIADEGLQASTYFK